MLWPCGADYTQSSGATAVVMVLVGESIVVANLGDSRCVIQRSATSPPPAQAGAAFATVDHKPSSVDETARIEAAGGTVVGNRVNGLLGVSRALGDFEMKDPAVSAHPCPMPMHCTAAAKARLRTALCCPHTHTRAHTAPHMHSPPTYMGATVAPVPTTLATVHTLHRPNASQRHASVVRPCRPSRLPSCLPGLGG